MKVQYDLKLDFDDTLLVPHRTHTASRKTVELSRTFQFYHANKSWTGVPIIAANMDSTVTLAMSNVFGLHKMITCLHKYYDHNEILTYHQLHN